MKNTLVGNLSVNPSLSFAFCVMSIEGWIRRIRKFFPILFAFPEPFHSRNIYKDNYEAYWVQLQFWNYRSNLKKKEGVYSFLIGVVLNFFYFVVKYITGMTFHINSDKHLKIAVVWVLQIILNIRQLLTW